MKESKQVEEYFRRYLRIGPLALALWRSVEAKHLSRVKLKRPILDIGCGFGEFAVAFADEPIDMGLDINSRDLYVASKTGKYRNLTLGDARDMPFSDHSYGSIFSISTLEHIVDSDKVLKEAYRVLRPGGFIFLTIETDEVEQATFYRPLMKRIGLVGLSNFTYRAYNKLFHRETLLPKSVWRKKVEKAGFKIETFKDIISPEVNRLFDIWLVTAWPSMLLKPFVGKRVVFRPKFMENYLTNRFLRHVIKEEKQGTNLLIIAKKPLR